MNTLKVSVINILEHIKLKKTQRIKHINLKSSCNPSVIDSKSRDPEFKNPDFAKIEAIQNLSEHLNISGLEDSGNLAHVVHACCNNTSAPNGFVCTNPEHMWFATSQEAKEDAPLWKKHEYGTRSWKDLTPEKRQARKKKMSAAVRNFYWNTEEGAKLRKKQSQSSTANMEKQLASGKHISQQIVECPWCGKQGNKRVMSRWHFDNCKHNPENNQDKP